MLLINSRPPFNSLWRAMCVLHASLLLISPGPPVLRAQSKKPVVPPWIAPEAAKNVQNPVKPSPQGLKIAARLFKENCAACHGAAGAGNGPLAKTLVDKPMNFTDAKAMKAVSDGELFWKITSGRLPMPSWAQFSDIQRWELVIYVRTLGK